MDIEREIDYRVQSNRIRLGQEPVGMRDRIRRDIEREEEWHKLHPEPEPLIFPFKSF